MWHASAAWQTKTWVPVVALRRYVFDLLQGYGDASLGEWEEPTGAAFHLRRRLSADEEALVGPPVDVRGTAEASRRAQAVRKWVMEAGPDAEGIAAREVAGR